MWADFAVLEFSVKGYVIILEVRRSDFTLSYCCVAT